VGGVGGPPGGSPGSLGQGGDGGTGCVACNFGGGGGGGGLFGGGGGGSNFCSPSSCVEGQAGGGGGGGSSLVPSGGTLAVTGSTPPPAPTVTISYTLVAAVPQPQLAGSRIEAAGGPDIYLIDDDGTKRHIPDPTTYNNLFRDWTGIKTVDPSTVTSGPDLTSGAYLAWAGVDGDPIYLVTNGQKRHIASPAVFDKFWFASNKVQTVPQSTLDALPNGPDLT
jgi:hypothetical protein